MPFAAAAIPALIGGVASTAGGSLISKILGGAGVAAGATSDVMRAMEQQKVINQIMDWTKMLEKMPASDITAQAEQAARPLSTGLIENVANVVQAQLGERGLAGSPGMAAEFMGQALAPYEMQQLQDALQAEFFHLDEPIKALGLASESLSGGGSNLSPLLAALMSKSGGGGGGGGGTSLDDLLAMSQQQAPPIFVPPNLPTDAPPPDLLGTGMGGMDLSGLSSLFATGG